MAEFTETITVNCPDCDSGHIVKIGQRDGYQRYLCRDCLKKFRTTGRPPARRPTLRWSVPPSICTSPG